MKETSTRMLHYSVQSIDQLHCINLLSFIVKGLEIYKRKDYFMLAQLRLAEKLLMFLIIIKVYVFKNMQNPPQFMNNFHRLQIISLYYFNFRTNLPCFGFLICVLPQYSGSPFVFKFKTAFPSRRGGGGGFGRNYS